MDIREFVAGKNKFPRRFAVFLNIIFCLSYFLLVAYKSQVFYI